MRGHQRGVQVNDHPGLADLTGNGTTPSPHLLASRGTGGSDRRGRGVDLAGQGRDQPGHGGIGGHLAEHLRLGADHRDIGQAVPAKRDRSRHVEQHLARVVHRPVRTPRRQRPRQRPVHA